MANKKNFLLLGLLALAGSLQARIFNDNGSGAVDAADGVDNKVHTQSRFYFSHPADANATNNKRYHVSQGSVFFPENSAVIVAEGITGDKGNQALMKASLSGSSFTVENVTADALITGADTFLRNLIKTPNGNIAMLNHGPEAAAATIRGQLKYVKNPLGLNSSSPEVIDLSGAADILQDSAGNGKIDIFASAGNDPNDSNVERFVVAVLDANSTEDNSSDEDQGHADKVNGRIRVVTFNTSNDTFTRDAGVAKRSDNQEVTMNTESVTAPAFGNLTAGAAGDDHGFSHFGAMHWNPWLKRFYMGTKRLHAGAASNRRFIVVGRVKEDEDPAGQTAAVTGDKDLILEAFAPYVATKVATTSATAHSVNHINSMRTSTGKDYLVVQIQRNANIQDPDSKKVHVLPLVSSSTASDQGKVANKDFSAAATVAGDLYGPNDIQALVGGAALPANNSGEIKAIHVQGDVVFAVVAVDTAANDGTAHRSGVYASKALFDNVGNIAAWTAWTKVIASPDANLSAAWTNNLPLITNQGINQINNIGFDNENGRMFYVFGKNGTAVNKIGVTQWGQASDNGFAFSMKNLTTKINSDFAAEGGVWGAYSFPAMKTMGLGDSGLTVIFGNDKVGVFSSGGLWNDGLSNGSLYPVNLADVAGVALEDRPYASASYTNKSFDEVNISKHYKKFSVGATVLCAEIGRVFNRAVPATNYPKSHGFLFVGTDNGVYVLSRDNGAGWDASVAGAGTMGFTLQDFSAVTGLSQSSFKKIPGIDEPVHDLVSTDRFLFVMTRKAVYRIRLHAEGDATVATYMNTIDAVPTMFTSNMTSNSVASTIDLLTDKASYPDANVVIQKVLDAGSNEIFVNMVGIPNSAVLFVGSIEGNNSHIYGIKDGNISVASGGTGVFLSDTLTDYRKTLTGKQIRKLMVCPANVRSVTLQGKDGVVNSDDGLSINFENVIANLYVMTGSVFDKNSKVYAYAIFGTASNWNTQNLIVNNELYAYPSVTMPDDNTWITNTDDGIPFANTIQMNALANSIDATGQPFVLQHSGDLTSGSRTNNHLRLLDSSATNGIRDFSTDTPSNSHVFGSVRLEGGHHMLFGTFGVRISE